MFNLYVFSKDIEYKEHYCNALAKLIDKVDNVQSIVEVGIGEATTLCTLIKFFKNQPSDILGFDISWSRLKFGKALLNDLNMIGEYDLSLSKTSYGSIQRKVFVSEGQSVLVSELLPEGTRSLATQCATLNKIQDIKMTKYNVVKMSM